MSDFLTRLRNVRPVFTVGDLVEGLGFMEEAERRAVLFGMEQQLTANQVTEMTHRLAMQLPLTPLSREIIFQQARHIRLDHLFWIELQGGVVAPITGLDLAVRQAFAGMSWDDLQLAYRSMAMIDHDADYRDFLSVARAEGLIH
jgi:hypothetical protein